MTAQAYDFTPASNAYTIYQPNALNQIASITNQTTGTTKTFSYDPKGNLTSDGTNSYSYDDANRMGLAPNNALAWDGLDRFYSQYNYQSGATTNYLYDGDELIAEYDGSGNLLSRYVHGPGIDNPVVWYNGSGASDRRWLMANEQGSIMAVASASGQLLAANTYDEYGLPGSSNLGRFQYVGQAWIPEIGLYYDKARMYSPSLGRFMQTDPIGYGDGLNWYAYAHNDPVNGRDPSGLETCTVESDSLSTTADIGGGAYIGSSPAIGNCDDPVGQSGGDGVGSNGSAFKDQADQTKGFYNRPQNQLPQSTKTPAEKKVNCSRARQQVYALGVQIDNLGAIGKRVSLGAGALGLGGLGAGALTGQLEVALPGALTLSRAVTGYELSAAVSSIGVDLKAIATQNPTGPLLDQLNDQISDILGLGDFSKDLLSEALGAAEGEQAAC